MYNLVYVIGRLTKEVELVKEENGKAYSVINLAVQRSYKNVDGIYETDFIDVRLHKGIAESTAEYCKKGDLVGIRGRVENNFEEKDGEKISKTIIVGDKISFLAAQKKHDKKRRNRNGLIYMVRKSKEKRVKKLRGSLLTPIQLYIFAFFFSINK